MADTTFTNGVTLSDAAWFQDINDHVYKYVIVASPKVLHVSNSLTLAGTDATTMTFPTTSATIARTDAANTFSGTQSFAGLIDASGVSAGQIKFPLTLNASSNANTLDDYDEYAAASTACTGAITDSVTWNITKIGKNVTLTIPQIITTATGTNSFTVGLAIPAKYRPTNNIYFQIWALSSGIDCASGALFVNASTGVITAYHDLAGGVVFANGASCGIEGTSVSWTQT